MFIWKAVFFISLWKSVPGASLGLKLRSQRSTEDSRLFKIVYACEHNELHISCEESAVIHVIRANYGRSNIDLCNDDGRVVWSGQNCMAYKSYEVVIGRCERKQSCSVKASNTVFRDPCIGTIKYLEVQYTCVTSSFPADTNITPVLSNSSTPSDHGSVLDATLEDSRLFKILYSCEHNELNISCEESTVIHVIRANYGRSSIDLCNDDGRVVWSGRNCIAYKSYEVVIGRCERKQSCSVKASNTVFGDPCIGTIKYLEVQYACVTSSFPAGTNITPELSNRSTPSDNDSVATLEDSRLFTIAYSCEYNELHISCEESAVIHVIRANYGRSSIDLCNDDGRVVWTGQNCMAYKSYDVVIDRCEQKESCRVEVSNTVFGDPCIGTIKYLEVQYACVTSLFPAVTNRTSALSNSSAPSDLDSASDNTLVNSHLFKTVNSCEHKVLHISCKESSVIHVIRANYGRSTTGLCNDDGGVVWSGRNCMAYRSYDVVIDRCEQKESCSVKASNEVFGDPCRGTIKYLEVQYVCVSPSYFTSTTATSTIFNTTFTSDLESVHGSISSETLETKRGLNNTVPTTLPSSSSSSSSETPAPEKKLMNEETADDELPAPEKELLCVETPDYELPPPEKKLMSVDNSSPR